MRANWVDLAEHWAWWGRLEVLRLHSNTNNLVERCFGLVKYTDLNRKTQSTIHELLQLLLTKTVPRYMHTRSLMLAGRCTSGQQQHEQRAARAVEEMVAAGAVHAAEEGGAPGATYVRTHQGNVRVCIGDLSCSCTYSGKDRCMRHTLEGLGT